MLFAISAFADETTDKLKLVENRKLEQIKEDFDD